MRIFARGVAFTIVCCAALAAQATRALRVVDLEGTPYERGFHHGEVLSDEITALLAKWSDDVEQRCGTTSDVFARRFLAATRFDEAARRYTPDLLDEVRGIAAGANQSFETMLAYQYVDELWAQAGLVAGEKCSTIGVDRDGDTPGFVAQNLDLPLWMHAYPTVLRVRYSDRDLESLVVTLPGLVGANGVNSARVAVGVNTILQLRPSPDGLPVAFVVRGLLAQSSHQDALAFLKRVPHASGQAYTVGGPDASPCFECSAQGAVRWQPEGREGWTWHTNHPLVSRDWSAPYLARAKSSGFEPVNHPRCPRFDALDRALAAGTRPTREQALDALRIADPKTPVCNSHTYTCTLMLLGPEPELHIASGRPDRNAFVVLRFTRR